MSGGRVRPVALGRAISALSLLVAAALVTELWLGVRATREWQRSSNLLVERRTRENADLLVTALTRDMQGVHATVLSRREWSANSFRAPFEARGTVAGAFARYPYPEAFFGWTGRADEAPLFFVRTGRRPHWLVAPDQSEPYPVDLVSAPALGVRLLAALRADLLVGRRDSLLEVVIEGEPYQVVTHISYAERQPGTVAGAFGFLVNLKRVRQVYFADILQQVARLADADKGLDYALIDQAGEYVVSPRGARDDEVIVTRELPFLFVDSRLVSLKPPGDGFPRRWQIQVSPIRDDTLAAAAQGARTTFLAIASATVALAVGLFFTVRAARATVALASLRSDFVSTVTHELKTPLSTIRAVAETLLRGRLGTPEAVHRYAQLLMQESRRLTRLVDNLLAYARVTDVTEVYSFEAMDPAALIDEAMLGFARLADVAVEITLQNDLPLIRVDRTSMVLALDNLIDNAIRYSRGRCTLTITAEATGNTVLIRIVDKGVGIAADDLKRVTRRFVRGRSPRAPGSGLGLAIVERVLADHGGRMDIRSEVEVGTEVVLSIPVAQA